MPDTIDYTALARAVQEGYADDNATGLVNGFSPSQRISRKEGLYRLGSPNAPFSEIERIWEEHEALSQITILGKRPNTSFFIHRDLLVKMLYGQPNVHGLQFVLGAQTWEDPRSGIMNKITGQYKSIKRYTYQLLWATATYSLKLGNGFDELGSPQSLGQHSIILPFYGQSSQSSDWEAQPRYAVTNMKRAFEEFGRGEFPRSKHMPYSYFVGRYLLANYVLGIQPQSNKQIDAEAFQRGYEWLRVDLILENANLVDSMNQCVGLAVRGVRDKTTSLLIDAGDAIAGPVYCTRKFIYPINGANCTLPCPPNCPDNMPE